MPEDVSPMTPPLNTDPITPQPQITTPTPVQEMPVVTTPSVTTPPPDQKSGSKKGLIITLVLALSAVAIIGGLSFAIKTTTKDVTTQPQAATQATPTPTPTPKTLSLTFTSLKDGDTTNNKTLKVTGTTGVKATVSVVGGSDDVIFNTDGTPFSVDVPLAVGENKLVFTAQDDSDNQVTETRSIFYSEDITQ